MELYPTGAEERKLYMEQKIKKRECPICNGKGTLPNPYKVPVPYPQRCWRCKGSGVISEYR